MKHTLLIILLLLSIGANSQRIDSLILKTDTSISSTRNELITLRSKIETLVEKIDADKKNWIERNGVWLVALLIGLITVLSNFFINKTQRKSNEAAINLQVENSKKIALKQITNSTISNFRLKWIEEVRDCVSEFISVSHYVYLKAYLRKENDKELTDEFKKLTFLQEKIELYLNTEKESQKEIMNTIKEIRYILYDENLKEEERKKIVTETSSLTKKVSDLLEHEWKRVKKEVSA